MMFFTKKIARYLKNNLKILALTCALVLLCSCALFPFSAQTPAEETTAVIPIPPPTAAFEPTESPAEIARRERLELLQAAAQNIASELGEEIAAEDFLLWLEGGKYPQAVGELGVLPPGIDLAEFLRERTRESIFVLKDGFRGILDSVESAAENDVFFSVGGGGDTVIALAGDVNFIEGSYVMPSYRAAGSSLSAVFTGGILEEMLDADIFLVNNEFAFTNRGAPIPGKTYTFRSSPENVTILSDMGVDIAFLANNHVFDYGEDGLFDTLNALEDEGIPSIGAGMNLGDASKPVYYIVNGRKIAFVGAGCIERYSVFTPGATDDSAGIFRTDEKIAEAFLEVIRSAAENSDYVIANLHWGIESTSELEDYQRELGRMCIDAGASAVVGSHPHVLQGVEFYDGRPIIYSTGNFWFSQTQNYTCLIKLVIDDSGELEVRFVPCVTGGGVTRLAVSDEAAKIIQYYNSISFDVEIDDEGLISGID